MKKPRKRTTLKEEAGKMLLDIGRMVFAGVVIVEILRRRIIWVDEDVFHDILLVAGVAMVFLCYTLGINLVKREMKTPKAKRPTRPAVPIHMGLRGKRRKV